MYEAKTRENDGDVQAYLNRIESPNMKADAGILLDLFSGTTGLPPRMWGDSIIGFGSVHYRYATGHEGDTMIVGFAPRKGKFSLYLAAGFPEREEMLARLGRHTSGVACVYVNKLADIHLPVLKELIERSVSYMKELYPDP